MFKNSTTLKVISKDNLTMSNKQMFEMNLTMQEKLEIILERPNYCQLRAAEDAASSDSE